MLEPLQKIYSKIEWSWDVRTTSKNLQFLIQLNIYICYTQQSHSYIFTQERLKTYVHTKICRLMFITVFFIIAPNWRQSKYQWVIKQIVEYSYNRILLSNTNKLLVYMTIFCCCLVTKLCLTLLWPPWTETLQAPLSMGFPRQEYRSGFPFPLPGDLPDPGIKSESPALAGRLFTIESSVWIHEALYWVKETGHKRLYTLWLHVYRILERVKPLPLWWKMSG